MQPGVGRPGLDEHDPAKAVTVFGGESPGVHLDTRDCPVVDRAENRLKVPRMKWIGEPHSIQEVNHFVIVAAANIRSRRNTAGGRSWKPMHGTHRIATEIRQVLDLRPGEVGIGVLKIAGHVVSAGAHHEFFKRRHGRFEAQEGFGDLVRRHFDDDRFGLVENGGCEQLVAAREQVGQVHLGIDERDRAGGRSGQFDSRCHRARSGLGISQCDANRSVRCRLVRPHHQEYLARLRKTQAVLGQYFSCNRGRVVPGAVRSAPVNRSTPDRCCTGTKRLRRRAIPEPLRLAVPGKGGAAVAASAAMPRSSASDAVDGRC